MKIMQNMSRVIFTLIVLTLFTQLVFGISITGVSGQPFACGDNVVTISTDCNFDGTVLIGVVGNHPEISMPEVVISFVNGISASFVVNVEAGSPSSVFFRITVLTSNASCASAGNQAESLYIDVNCSRPANDNCGNAIQLLAEQDNCTPSGGYDNTRASASAMSSSCIPTIMEDIFFETMAESSEMTIELAIPFSSGRISVYESCNGTEVYCSVLENSNLVHLISGLTIGNDYIIRIASDPMAPDGTIDICVWSPPCIPPTTSIVVNNNQSCFNSCDGSATASGGVSYLWDTGETTTTSNILCGGIHFVTITDAGGCDAIDSIDITYDDTEDPVAICKGITIDIYTFSSISVNALDLDNSSTDNCGIVSRTAIPPTLNCDDIGINQVSLIVSDLANNTDICVADVTLIDSSENLWIGGASGNWNDNTSNWSLGRIPTECDNIRIPNGVTVSLQAGMSGYGYTLDVENGGSLIVDQTAILNIQIE